ncbi:MAG: DUF86 domain-containing protein [Methanomicrobiales archaeon]|nr:DUF86 domain-containing protein [Methanomicrobiales archaeon]
MAGIRDKLIHACSGINRAITWRTLRDDIPPLRPRMATLRDGLAAEETGDRHPRDL